MQPVKTQTFRQSPPTAWGPMQPVKTQTFRESPLPDSAFTMQAVKVQTFGDEG